MLDAAAASVVAAPSDPPADSSPAPTDGTSTAPTDPRTDPAEPEIIDIVVGGGGGGVPIVVITVDPRIPPLEADIARNTEIIRTDQILKDANNVKLRPLLAQRDPLSTEVDALTGLRDNLIVGTEEAAEYYRYLDSKIKADLKAIEALDSQIDPLEKVNADLDFQINGCQGIIDLDKQLIFDILYRGK